MRLPLRFSLRTLIVAITLVCIVAGFHAYVLRSRAIQRGAVEKLIAAGAFPDPHDWGIEAYIQWGTDADLGEFYDPQFRRTSLYPSGPFEESGWLETYNRFLTEGVIYIDLDKATIGMSEFRTLKEFPHLRILDIDECTVADEVQRHGKLDCNLRSLSINETSMANVHAEFFDIPSLKFLEVSSAEIDDSIVARLATLPKLRELDLCGNPAITDRGVAELARLDRLERLWLYDTQVTASGIMQLVGNPHLKYVGLLRTSVSLEDLPALQEAFPNTEFLIDLSQESTL